MIEQTLEEVIGAIHEDPETWAKAYLEMKQMLDDLAGRVGADFLAVADVQGEC